MTSIVHLLPSRSRIVPLLEPDYVALEQLAALAECGVRPYVQAALPLEEAAKAHQLAEAGGVQGKIVLTM